MIQLRSLSLIAVLVWGGAWKSAPPGPAAPFEIKHTWKIGGEGGWDYLAVDPQSKLLYITHGPRVAVVDTKAGRQVAEIEGLHGTHGIVFADDGVHGYITDGGGNQVAEFNRKTNRIEKFIPAGTNPDGAVLEPVTKTVWAFNGRSHNVTVIDTKTDAVTATMDLPGKPEFPVADGRGNIFDNIEDKSEIVRLDAKTRKVTAVWPLAPCESPSGLAIDRVRHRLFAVCDNQKMAVVDAESGRVVATPTIGEGPDAAAFSAADGLIFSSNGESGDVTVLREEGGDRYPVIQTLKTKQGARTMTLDPDGRRFYVVTADFGPQTGTAGEHRRRAIVPGSFEVLVGEK